ncbi:ABC transporter permease [Caproicibacter fermentans]|uniref:ABC transporter permease n=1 Tax=Caproicibacter fermentans TaxID=2576756 RepID=A0A7G8T8X4_9FIRM|nr:ABC transporter permease [Caproicibacter fermentans]QNK40065.1 ABC transporter permease [Caproicibacter fermentans]
MTSTTSCLNRFSQFRRTYFWSLRKNIGMAVLLALLLFLANPLILLISLPGEAAAIARNTDLTQAERTESLSRSYTNMVGGLLPAFAVAIVLLFCAILCVLLFGYLQKKRSVDLYHAMPVGREALLLGRWCAGITVLFVPVLLDFISMRMIGAAYGVSVTDGAKSPLISMLWVLLMGAAAFTFCLFMMVCAGTTLDAVLSALGVNVGYPLLILCVYTVAGMLLPGFSANIADHLTVATAFAPFAAAFVAVLRIGSAWFLLWWVALTAVLLAGSVLLYRRRRSESAEDNFAFPLPKLLVRFLLTAVGGLGFGLVLNGASDTAFFIGVLCGSLATHVIVEVIYSRGFHQMKKSFAWYGVFAVVFVAFFGALCTGLFGYDTRVPDASQVESVSIDADSYWSGSGSQTVYDESFGNRILALSPTIRQEENIKAVVGIQQELIKKYRARYPYCLKTNQGNGLTLSYRMKDGSVFKRTYRSYTDQMNLESMLKPAYDKLNGMKEFVESEDLVFYLSPENFKSIEIYNGKASSKTFVPDAQQAAQFQNALEQDFLDGKVNRRYEMTQEPEKYLDISLDYQEKIEPGEKMRTLLGGYKGKINLNGGNYSFTDESAATWKLLKQWGWVE